jgi:hypothetical protein
MSAPGVHTAGPPGGQHPAVLSRRIRDLLLLGAGGAVALVVALAIALQMPTPNILLVLAIVLGALGVIVLVSSTRYTVTLTLLALYLGLFDGPVKLESASTAASAVRNVLILAIALGMVVRLAVSGRRVRLPPLGAGLRGHRAG